MTDQPRVSILIPNYNNGKESSCTKQDDLITELLESLEQTLSEDPTPFEIIAYDDGSTDDSLQTLRDWSQKKLPNGQPFLKLIEDEHCGVLARTANIMSRMAKGDILARLDGDIVCLTKNWVSELARIFDEADERLGVIGPKQLKPTGQIHSYGDFVLHPNGYIHIGCNFPREAVKQPLEVDHVMGCFYCCRKAVFDDLGGYDEDFLRGQTIDFGMRARLAGWKCFAVPSIEFIHQHTKRENRSTKADSKEGVEKTLKIFESKWGFNRLAPDLDVVKQKYAGTPLLWNPYVFGDKAGQKAAPTEITSLEASQWVRFTKEEAIRNKVNLRVTVALDIVRQTSQPGRVAVIGANDGLVPHILATRGLTCVAVDEREPYLNFARQVVATQQYPAGRPHFLYQSNPLQIPLEDNSVDLVLIDSMLERHPNPVALLNEAWRVLAPDRYLGIVSQRGPVGGYDPSDSRQFDHLMTDGRRYLWLELINQIHAVGGWQMAIDIKSDDRSRDLVVIAQRVDKPAAEQSAEQRVACVA